MTAPRPLPKKPSHVWVVEMLCGKRWLGCIAKAFRLPALREMSEWSRHHPDHRFRIAKYERVIDSPKERRAFPAKAAGRK